MWPAPRQRRHLGLHDVLMSEIVVPRNWRERLEELSAGRKDMLLLAGILALLIVGAVFMWRRGGEPQVAPPSLAPSVGAAVVEPVSPTVGAPGSSSGAVLVHVAGAVRRPGLYELPMGARVADAIDAARGPRRKADLDLLNLAEPLVDGQKIDVPTAGESLEPAAVPPSVQPGASPNGLINVNTADQTMFETIPGIGPVTASAIVGHRDEIGEFTSIEQLLDVTGIGPATLEAMRPYISL